MLAALHGARWPYRALWIGASPWQVPTLVFWALSRLTLLLYITMGHHLCDRVFWLYGHRTVALHAMPYRDYAVEYPPLAMALFMLPGAAPTYTAYALGFAGLMVLVDLLTLITVKGTAVRLRLWADGWQAAFFYALLSFINAGVLTKFDLLPGLLTLAAVALLVRERDRAAWIVLAAAVLLKGYALVLVPLFLLYRSRRPGGAAWWRGPLAGAVATALVLLPVLLLTGPQFAHSILFHARRGLEIESIYGTAVLIAHQALGLHITVTAGVETTSRDVFSASNGPLLAALPWVLGVGLLATYVVAWVRLRADPAPEALLLLSMAAVAAFMIAFKALPAYYLLWLGPAAAVILGRPTSCTSAAATAFWLAIGLGAVVPMLWLPLQQLDPLAIAALAGRNAAIVALFVLLLHRAWPRRRPEGYPSGTSAGRRGACRR